MPVRSQALDELRGVSMLLLVLVGPLLIFRATPAWLLHAPGEGLHAADLIVPMFLFALGIAYPISLRRRLKTTGVTRTAFSFARRYGLLLAFGLLGEVARYRDLTFAHWGMLEVIGLTGIVVFPLMFVSAGIRLLVGGLGLVAWQIALDHGYAATAHTLDLGGPAATLAWTFIVLLGSILSEWRASMDRKKFLMFMACASVVGIVAAWSLGLYVPIDKHLVSISYVLAGVGCAAGVFLCFECLEERGIVCNTCTSFGRNSILLYIIAGLEMVAIGQFIPPSLPFSLALLVAFGAYAPCHILARVLDRKGIYIKI